MTAWHRLRWCGPAGLVRLRAGASGVAISALAKAEQSGRLGERIRVRSIDFMKPLRARVVGAGEVQID